MKNGSYYKAKAAMVLDYEKASDIESQKARGILLIASQAAGPYERLPTLLFPVRSGMLFESHDRIEAYPFNISIGVDGTEYDGNLFYFLKKLGMHTPIVLRACPVVPRHGILENTYTILGDGDIISICREMSLDMFETGEAYGAIAIQPFIRDAHSNVVWSDGHAIIAPEFDGATAGKKPSISLNEPYTPFIRSFLLEHGSPGENYELEFVNSPTGEIIWTQIRKSTQHKSGGMTIIPNSIPGFVPDPEHPKRLFEYDKIIKVKGTDLAGLENLKEKDVLVMHEEGNFMSHASAHARQNGWSYITTVIDPNSYKEYYVCEPVPGSVLFLKTPSVGMKVSTAEYREDFFRGIFDVIARPIKTPGIWNGFSFSYAFHNFATCKTLNPEIAYLAGIFSGMLIKSACAIALGEMRHYLKCTYETDNFAGRRTWDEFSKALSEKFAFNKTVSRDQIYGRVFKTDILTHLDRVIYCMRALRMMYERMSWASSYGGPNWAAVVKLLIRTLISLRGGNMNLLLKEVNKLTNAAHNCGWAFNKFTAKESFLFFTKGFLYSPFWNNALRCSLDVLKQNGPPMEGVKTSPIFVKADIKEAMFAIAQIFSEDDSTQKKATGAHHPHHMKLDISWKNLEKVSSMNACFESVTGIKLWDEPLGGWNITFPDSKTLYLAKTDKLFGVNHTYIPDNHLGNVFNSSFSVSGEMADATDGLFENINDHTAGHSVITFSENLSSGFAFKIGDNIFNKTYVAFSTNPIFKSTYGHFEKMVGVIFTGIIQGMNYGLKNSKEEDDDE